MTLVAVGMRVELLEETLRATAGFVSPVLIALKIMIQILETSHCGMFPKINVFGRNSYFPSLPTETA